MAQAEPDVSRIPSGVTLTKKGERYLAETPLPPPDGLGSPLARLEGNPLSEATSTRKASVWPAGLDGDAIGEKNRLTIGRQIEELLRIRREADATALRLIRLLDLHHLDPDLEPEEDESDLDLDAEPSIGWSSTVNQTARAFHGPRTEYDAEADDADTEPSLGGAEQHPTSCIQYTVFGDRSAFGFTGVDTRCSQDAWAAGDGRDLEDEHDGREDGHDDEPSLGWTDMESRYGRYPDTLIADAEEQCEDEGMVEGR